MARWINVKPSAIPFDYRWPDRQAITAFTAAGDHLVKDEVADFIVGRKFGTEGKAEEKSRSRKGKATPASRATTRASSVKKAPDAAPAHTGRKNRLGDAGLPVDGGADAGRSMDQVSG